MKKATAQLFLALLLFFGLWYSLSLINYVDETTGENLEKETEAKIGSLLLKQIDLKYRATQNDSLFAVVDDIHRRLCEANGIDPETIDVHIFNSDIPNALALPGRNVVFFTGMLHHTENPEEFAGILAHEIAHIENHHIRDRLTREFGLTLLLTISGMDGAPEVLANMLRMISSRAYSREQEREADQTAAEYLVSAEIDPIHLANVLLRLSGMQAHNDQPLPGWISTHPDPRDRADALMQDHEGEPVEIRPLYAGNWKELMN